MGLTWKVRHNTCSEHLSEKSCQPMSTLPVDLLEKKRQRNITYWRQPETLTWVDMKLSVTLPIPTPRSTSVTSHRSPSTSSKPYGPASSLAHRRQAQGDTPRPMGRAWLSPASEGRQGEDEHLAVSAGHPSSRELLRRSPITADLPQLADDTQSAAGVAFGKGAKHGAELPHAIDDTPTPPAPKQRAPRARDARNCRPSRSVGFSQRF